MARNDRNGDGDGGRSLTISNEDFIIDRSSIDRSTASPGCISAKIKQGVRDLSRTESRM
jgi:hypothetical protein